jgi:hypothetical protein
MAEESTKAEVIEAESKDCIICGKTFYRSKTQESPPAWARVKMCSSECKKEHTRRLDRDRYKQKKKQTKKPMEKKQMEDVKPMPKPKTVKQVDNHQPIIEAKAAAHWQYISDLLTTHGTDKAMIETIGFHYKTAFIHGAGHMQELMETGGKINERI